MEITDRTFIRALAPAGHDITDEEVGCSDTYVVDAVTYYVSFLAELPDPAIFRASDATYGVYSAASQAGTHYTVLDSGLPGANEVLIDIPSGAVIAASEVTVYVSYRGYGRMIPQSVLSPPLRVTCPGVMDREAEDEVAYEELSQGWLFGGMTVSSLWPAREAITFTLAKGDGEGASTETVALAVGERSASASFGSNFSYAARDHVVIRVSANAAGVTDPVITLESA